VFTLYVFSRFGKRLPHSSARQYDAAGVRHVARWVAPKSGDRVKLRTFYSSNYVVGRVS